MRQSSRWSQAPLRRHLSLPARAARQPVSCRSAAHTGFHRRRQRSSHDGRQPWRVRTGSGTSIGRVTMTIHTSETSARDLEADALIVGVVQAADGPRPAPGSADVDDALGGTLTDLLTALDATGRAEEITKIPAAGQLPAPVIVAVGLGAPGAGGSSPDEQFDPETLRRAAGAAVRVLTAARPAGLAAPAGGRRGRPRPGQREAPHRAGPAGPRHRRDRGRSDRRAARRVRVPALPDHGRQHRRGADAADRRGWG